MLHILLSIVLAMSPTYVSEDVLPSKEPQLPTFDQQIFLTKLVNCESGGNANIKVLDTNNKYSYGYLQFQMATFINQSKFYGLNYIEEDIFDFRKQVKLAHLMLLDGGENHWFNCTKPLGKYPK